ncbi:MAG: hypothetical protein ACFWTO_05340 [Hafnia paralvei]|jgi:proline dehydrogenase
MNTPIYFQKQRTVMVYLAIAGRSSTIYYPQANSHNLQIQVFI